MRFALPQTYAGRAYYNKTESVPSTSASGIRFQPRPREEWIPIAVPALVPEDTFEAAQRVCRDNSQWSPRRAEPGHWLLRRLVICGPCGVKAHARTTYGRRQGGCIRYYDCCHHDRLRAGGEEKRCRQPRIRADELDGFIFEQVRGVLMRPEVLLAGDAAPSWESNGS